MNAHYHYNFQFAVPWASSCNILFSSTNSKLISFNQGSSQVDSVDLLEFVPNKDKRVLRQTPINFRTLQQILDICLYKSDRGFRILFKLHYNFFCFFQKNVILLHFSLSVKAVTLIFISGRDLAISSTHEGKTGNIDGKTEKFNCLLRVYKYKLDSV